VVPGSLVPVARAVPAVFVEIVIHVRQYTWRPRTLQAKPPGFCRYLPQNLCQGSICNATFVLRARRIATPADDQFRIALGGKDIPAQSLTERLRFDALRIGIVRMDLNRQPVMSRNDFREDREDTRRIKVAEEPRADPAA
jgi:hypothetical protein